MNAPQTNIAERSERTKALDDFAAAPARDQSIAIAPVAFASPAERVFGAQNVAVYRDEGRILQKLKALAAAAGDDWFYRFPVNAKGGKQFIEGPSIKLANDVARIFGNCDVDVRVMDLGDSWLFYARFTDFETGYSLTRPFQQRKSQRAMKTDSERALDIAFQIGASKAIRNVVTNALQTFSDYAFEEARNSLVEKIGKDIERWRERTVNGIKNMGADLARVEAVVGRAAKDWLAPDVGRIIAMMKAIADGMATVDESFPPVGKKGQVADQSTGEVTDAEIESAKAGLDDFAKGEQQATNGNGAAQEATTETAVTDQQQQPATEQPATDKPTAETKKETKAKPEKADTPPVEPKTEREYVAYAEEWISNATDAAAAQKRWTDEKSLRNKSNVSGEARESLQEKLGAKLQALNAAG